MSSKLTIEKNTEAQVNAVNIKTLSDRPNVVSRYGDGGLSATQLKERFDGFPALNREKINQIIDALTGAESTKYLGIGTEALSEFGVDNLYDLLVKMTTAEISNVLKALHATEKDAESKAYTLNNIFRDVGSRLSELKVQADKVPGIDSRLTTAEGAINALAQDNVGQGAQIAQIQQDNTNQHNAIIQNAAKIEAVESKAETQYANINSAFNNHNGRLSTLETWKEPTNAQIIKNVNSLADHLNRIKALETDNTSNKGKISALEGDNTTNKSNISGHESRINALEIAYEDIAGTNPEVGGNITSIAERLAVAENKVDEHIKEADKTIAGIEEKVDGVFQDGTIKSDSIIIGEGETADLSIAGGTTDIDTYGEKAGLSNSQIAALKAAIALSGGYGLDGEVKLSKATAPLSIALGAYNESTSSGAIALGYGNKNSGFNSTAIGAMNTVSGDSAFAYGYKNTVNGDFGVAFGQENAAGYMALVGGVLSQATGNGSIAFGNECKATEAYAVALGGDCTASGKRAFACGSGTVASGNYSHAEGRRTVETIGADDTPTGASNVASHSEGYDTAASGKYAHAEGYNTTARGMESHAEGKQTKASGEASHAEGVDTQSTGFASHAEGEKSIAGNYAHAEGYNTKANGDHSHAEGSTTIADGVSSHAEGWYTKAGYYTVDGKGVKTYYGEAAHAEGAATIASEFGAHAEGGPEDYIKNADGTYTITGPTTASAYYAHAEGRNTTAAGQASHAEGYKTVAQGQVSHAEGYGTLATSLGAHAEGVRDLETVTIDEISYNTAASAQASHSEGQNTCAIGNSSHAEGHQTVASGSSSHAEGAKTLASGGFSHAEGAYSKASAYYSHAEGYNTLASGDHSHAEGSTTTANGMSSHAEGWQTQALHKASHASGDGTITGRDNQTVIGEYNAIDENALFVVGNGDFEGRSNAFTVNKDGTAYVNGNKVLVETNWLSGVVDETGALDFTVNGTVDYEFYIDFSFEGQYYRCMLGALAFVEGDVSGLIQGIPSAPIGPNILHLEYNVSEHKLRTVVKAGNADPYYLGGYTINYRLIHE